MKATKNSINYDASDMMNQLQITLAQSYSSFMSERIKAGIQKRKAREQEKILLIDKEGAKKW